MAKKSDETQGQEQAAAEELSFPNLEDPETKRVLEAQRQHHLNDDGKIIPINKFCKLERCGMPLVRSTYTDPNSPLVCSWDPRHPQE